MTNAKGEPIDEKMSEFLALPPMPDMSIEERLENIETSLHNGFEGMIDFKESVDMRFEEFHMD